MLLEAWQFGVGLAPSFRVISMLGLVEPVHLLLQRRRLAAQVNQLSFIVVRSGFMPPRAVGNVRENLSHGV